MKKQTLLLLTLSGVALASCTDRPFLYANEDGDKPAYSQQGGGQASAESRAPLDVPPELRNVEVPQPERIATTEKGGIATAADETVVGTAVALDARLYSVGVANVFSSVVDAMTALNMPVQSVDSPSGTITTDWIRQGADNPNLGQSAMAGLFGGDGVQAVRYRFVVRTLRQLEDGVSKTRLEIRTIGQAYINRHWVNRPIQRKVSEELFSAVEERLTAIAPASQQ